jgi:hypothetical protein
VIQQILLESSAMSLSANVVAKGFESWNGTSAQTLRNTLGIASSIVPLYVLPVGHVIPTPTPTPTPTSTPGIPEFLLVFAVLGLIAIVSVSMIILKRKLKIRADFNEKQ